MTSPTMMRMFGLGVILAATTACAQPQERVVAPSPQAEAPATTTSPTAPTTTAQANPNESADDAAERVENALENDPTLAPFDLDADDRGNAIVIKGRVQNESQRALAEQIATQTAPGFEIINEVAVQ